ncbi:MAG: type 1 glutamine amidotransferase [Bdellovibrionota bacterium]
MKKAAEGLGEVEVVAVRAPDGAIPSRLEEFDGVVLSGSKTRIEETEPWIEKEMDAIRTLYALKIPTFGICYGEQLIARTFGGKAGTANTYEYGWVEIDASKSGSPLFEGLPKKFYSFEYHSDEVTSLPANFKLTASSKDCPVQAFDLSDAPMCGVQFHPERGLRKGKENIKNFLEKNGKAINADQADKLFDPKVGETIFRNFLKKVWAKR